MTETTGTGTRDGSGNGRRWPRRLGYAALVLLGLFFVVWFVVIPFPWTLGFRDPDRTALMEQRIREARAAGDDAFEIRQRWVPLDSIAPAMIRAVIVAEDHRFREHEGIDWQALAEEVRWTGDDDFSWVSADDRRALLEAVRYVRENAETIRGRSTITQQLAKNLWWGTERSFVRKAGEFVAAGRLERLGKERILELYLNLVEFGPGIFGVEAAAQHYFDRPASRLTLNQAAQLAATLPHPLRSNPAGNPGRMRTRAAMLMRRLDPSPNAPELPPMPPPDPDFADVGAEGTPVPLDSIALGLEPIQDDSLQAADTIAPGGSDTLGAPTPVDTTPPTRRDTLTSPSDPESAGARPGGLHR